MKKKKNLDTGYHIDYPNIKKDSIVDKFGPVCKKHGVRHSSISTIGYNLPKDSGKECK